MANSTLDQALERWQAQAADARRRTQEQIAEARRRWESRVAAQRDGGSGLMEDEAPSDEDERDEPDAREDDRSASAERSEDEDEGRDEREARSGSEERDEEDRSESGRDEAEARGGGDRDARAQEEDRPESEGGADRGSRGGEPEPGRDEGRKLPGLITKGVPALLALTATKEAASAVARYRRRRSAFRSMTSGAALGSVAVLVGQTISNEKVRAFAARSLRNGVAALRNER
jgi:hypothetical protein